MTDQGDVPAIRRNDFLLALDDAVQRARASSSNLGMLLIDIANLARINHGQGYSVGDKMLISAYEKLIQLSKLPDTVFRIGGHGFAFLLPDLGNPALIALAINKVTEALRAVHPIDGSNIATDVRVGVALNRLGGWESLEMLAMAESSLAHVKLGGDHRLDKILSADQENMVDYQLEQYLAEAIRENQFELCYQPKVSLWTGQLVGAEALLRWSTPDGERVSPELVVRMAEAMGRTFDLTKWVMHQAMRQLKDWQGSLEIGMAINVQAELVSNPDLPELLRHATAIWGVEPELITVEITENAIIEDKEAGFSNLSQIRESGMKLSIDDFGTGYSSLSYFKHIPASELKIDKSFVTSLLVDSEDLELVKIMIQIAHQFGMTVVAEGVEERAILDLLRDLGCDVVQGYYVAPPMLPEEFASWAADWPGLTALSE